MDLDFLMKNMPKVSVIMPAFNAEKYIAEAIKSVLSQTHRGLELLIYNDGSTDATLEICEHWARTDSRIRLFSSTQNKGNLTVTNLLIQEVSGDFLAIQDADDSCHPQKIEKQLLAFKNNVNLVLLGSQYLKIDHQGAALHCGFLPCSNAQIKQEMQRKTIPVLFGSVLVKTSVVKKAGGFAPFFDRQGYADMDWLAKCALHGDVENLPEPLYYYREHIDSFSFSRIKPFFWSSFFELLLVEAHQQRLRGEADFFSNSDIAAIRTFLSEWHIQRGMDAIIDKEVRKAIQSIYSALRLHPLSRKTYSSLFYNLNGLHRFLRATERYAASATQQYASKHGR
jgi:glycosyltransferase involved in cell wall biosynthesis